MNTFGAQLYKFLYSSGILSEMKRRPAHVRPARVVSWIKLGDMLTCPKSVRVTDIGAHELLQPSCDSKCSLG